MRRPTTAAPPGLPARHAISPRRVPGAPLGLGDPLAGALQQLAADREAELGDLAGRLRGGGGELGAARARRLRLLEVLAASADAGRARRGPAAGGTVAGRSRAAASPPGSARTCAGRRPSASPSRRPVGFAAVLAFAVVFGFAFALGFAFVARFGCASAAGVASSPPSPARPPRRRASARTCAGRRPSRAASASLPRPSSPRRPSRSRSAARRRGPVPVLLPRRLPIRSGRALESDPSTPGSSFFAFAFCFLGLSAMSTRV